MALKVAIVGRPNVGKSTLFNRLAGKKLAIVDDRPGVTRDRRYGHGRIGDLDLELIDTAGFEDVTDESLEARMRAQTEIAIEECDVALLVIDARDGIVALDRVFVEVLRRHDRPVVLAANKAEGRAGAAGTDEAYELGLGEPVPISAEHGEGMADLYAALMAAAPVKDDDEDADAVDRPVTIAIVGRPNAGKSTLINRLVGEDRLLTGPEAGITRDAITVEWNAAGRRVRLVDTAGLRRRAKVHEKLEKLSTQDSIRAITFAEVVLLVMDATHPFEIQDLQIADLVEREGRALVFVLAKWDLVEDPQAQLKEFVEHAARMLPQIRGAPVVALSGETGQGIERLMPAIFKTHADWSSKIKTRDLNDWLAIAIQRHPPPAVNGRRIKPKYMAQTKARPPTFVLFASRADQLPDSYRRYLINSMRESFDLPGVPVRLSVKSSANPYAEDESERPSMRTSRAEAVRKAQTVRRKMVASAKEAPEAPSAVVRDRDASPGPAKRAAPKPSATRSSPSKSASSKTGASKPRKVSGKPGKPSASKGKGKSPARGKPAVRPGRPKPSRRGN
jgi:GTP-binding protein